MGGDKEGWRNDLIVIVAWFIGMPAMMVAVIWLMDFVPAGVGDWFVYLPMQLTQYLGSPGFLLGVVIMMFPIAVIIGLINGLINFIWRHLFSKRDG